MNNLKWVQINPGTYITGEDYYIIKPPNGKMYQVYYINPDARKEDARLIGTFKLLVRAKERARDHRGN